MHDLGLQGLGPEGVCLANSCVLPFCHQCLVWKVPGCDEAGSPFSTRSNEPGSQAKSIKVALLVRLLYLFISYLSGTHLLSALAGLAVEVERRRSSSSQVREGVLQCAVELKFARHFRNTTLAPRSGTSRPNFLVVWVAHLFCGTFFPPKHRKRDAVLVGARGFFVVLFTGSIFTSFYTCSSAAKEIDPHRCCYLCREQPSWLLRPFRSRRIRMPALFEGLPWTQAPLPREKKLRNPCPGSLHTT